MLLNIILEDFQRFALCENDKPYLKLAAGKSVLRLAARWDSHISQELFRSVLLMAKDSSYIVRKSFIDKLYGLLKKHAIPVRYACAFALASTDCSRDVRTESTRYLSEVLKEQRRVFIHQSRTSEDSIIDHPAYAVVFLIHTLAYDRNFPSNFCGKETGFAEFYSPLVVMLRELFELDNINETEHGRTISSVFILSGIFRAIQKAEDLIDSDKTPKLHILSKIGLFIVKELDKHCKMTNSPRHIPLPSSYYGLSKSERKTDECCQEDLITEVFVRAILKTHEPYNHQDDTKCSIIAEKTSNEYAPERDACSTLRKLVGQSANGHDKRKRNERSVPGKVFSEKKDQNTSHSLEKDKVSSSGSAGTKLSSPDSLGLTKEADSRNDISLLENQNLPANRSPTTETRDCSDLDEDVGDCGNNFVERHFSNNNTAVAGLKRNSKRALDLRNAQNSSGLTADTTSNVRRTRSRKGQS